jgi:hypothetical protein
MGSISAYSLQTRASKGMHVFWLLRTQARWAQEGLQTDSLSVENGAIMAAASRWPLMIDPQLQGVRWIVSREAKNGLVIIQQSQPKYIDQARRPPCAWLRPQLDAAVKHIGQRGIPCSVRHLYRMDLCFCSVSSLSCMDWPG